jgi:dienelactone hydrolase
MKALAVITILLLSMVSSSYAQLHTEIVEYKQGDTVLEGYLAYDQSIQGKRPGILVVHEWDGLGQYAKMRADMLAKLGYVAFAADIYGKGIRPTKTEDKAAQAGIYRANRQLMRARAQAGLDQLLKSNLVNPQKVAAIGYCFGGGVVLELARSGAPLAGIVSFHGNLDTPNPQDAVNIKGQVLILHGGSDPYVGPEQVTAFQKEMTEAHANWQMVVYGGAVHGFTNSNNGDDPSKGVAYNPQADNRSWIEMQNFFDGIFK